MLARTIGTSHGPPENVLLDTVARLQRDLDDMRAESRFLRTPGIPTVVPTSRHVAFTSTKVAKFAGTASWEQYRQVFDAIVFSNGRDDAAATLPFGGRHFECGPVGPGAPPSVESRTGGCVDGALWLAGSTGGLPATV